MNTASLYDRLAVDGKLSSAQRWLQLDPAYLGSLSSQLQATKLNKALLSYLPQALLRVTSIDAFSPPADGEPIRLSGTGAGAPFDGMRLAVELWTEPATAGIFELRLIVRAYGSSSGSRWTLGAGYPFYQSSLLGDLGFLLIDDSQSALLVLASHEISDRGIAEGMSCRGFIELRSILDTAPRLFLPDDAREKFAGALGSVAALPPEASDRSSTLRPSVSLFGALADSPVSKKLGGLFPIDTVSYQLKAWPHYSTASRTWEPRCSVEWVANLRLTLAADIPANAPIIPIGAEILGKNGSVRFWSELTDGLSLAWDSLAGCIPGVSLTIPTSGFQLRDNVKLTRLELLADRDPNRDLQVEWIGLEIETNQDSNRWVLIDRLLTLDAIDFHILVRDPLNSPSVHFSLSGLVGIGENGILRLTANFDSAAAGLDYAFSGQLLDDTPLDIQEVLTHFLGYSSYPAIPKLAVDDFSFSVQPNSKLYDGEILLSADWPLLGNLTLTDVYFRVHHDAGEGDSTFQAYGVFALAGVQLYVAADYISNGRGWTFTGGTWDDDEIPIGEWLAGMVALLGFNTTIPLPNPIRGLVLLNLAASINTTTQEYSFAGTARFPIDGKPHENTSSAELTVSVDFEQGQSTLRGSLTLFKREFAVAFSNANLLVATYNGANADPIDLKAFLSQISSVVGNQVPAGISIDLRHAQLAFDKTGDTSKFLFGIELGAGIQLSNLPLVGFLFSEEQSLTIVFHLLAVSGQFQAPEIRIINQLSGPDITPIPEATIGSSQAEFRLDAAISLGGFRQRLDLPLTTNVGSPNPAPGSAPAIAAAGGDGLVKWVDIDRAFGPFHFQRIGIGSNGENIAFLIDASLRTAGLVIALDGLSASCTFAELSKGNFKPSFKLLGLGVNFSKGDLKIGGALIKSPAGDIYDGALTLHYKRLGIAATGSFQLIDGGCPSLFIYALIDYPLGGPAFFFIEGGAVGFGYNRTLIIPSIDAVSEFPLVKHAMAPPQANFGPMDLARTLRDHIKPAAGQYFLAAGLRFSSYKTIEGFVLLTILFGDRFEIDVLGKATLTTPPRQALNGAKPIMSASLVLLGRYLPQDGLLMIQAQLASDAHLFAPDCHLSGGFALYCWFDGKNKGDFVLTLGGYHKSFAVPPHYPKVPRLALNWQVNPNLSLKADAYFAITPSAIMAGARLEANWQSGNLQAWFHAELDFLIAWQPVYYLGHAYVSIGARYRFEFFGKREISAELTAELDIWGPPFSGRARVQWYIISFEIAFGDPRPNPPDPLTWPAFRKSFLPFREEGGKAEDGRMFRVTVEGGKLAQRRAGSPTNAANPADLGVVNPRELYLAVRSPLPVKTTEGVLLGGAVEPSKPGETPKTVQEPLLGIAPMNRPSNAWQSSLEIKILYKPDGGNTSIDKSGQFSAQRIRAAVPRSLWDEDIDPHSRTGKSALIDNAVVGYEIRPAYPIQPVDAAGSIRLTWQDSTPAEKQVVRQPNPGGDPVIVKSSSGQILTEPIPRLRKALSEALNPADMNWTSVTVASWRHKPQIVKIATEPILS